MVVLALWGWGEAPLCSLLCLQLLGKLEKQSDESHPCRDMTELDQTEEGLW